jgi:hypothetical protein
MDNIASNFCLQARPDCALLFILAEVSDMRFVTIPCFGFAFGSVIRVRLESELANKPIALPCATGIAPLKRRLEKLGIGRSSVMIGFADLFNGIGHSVPVTIFFAQRRLETVKNTG